MIQVFLSSTGKDLWSYRKSVTQAINGLTGFKSFQMEDYAADARPPKQWCIDNVVGSTLFVCIIGHCYGSLPPGEEQSYTEIEYEAARSSGLDRLLFVAHEDFLTPASALIGENDGHRANQRRFRERIQAGSLEKLKIGFDSPEQLATLVVSSILEWLQRRAIGVPQAIEAFKRVSLEELIRLVGASEHEISEKSTHWVTATRIADGLAIDVRAVLSLCRAAQQQTIPPESLVARLAESAKEHWLLSSRLAAGVPNNQRAAPFLDAANEAVSAGRYDEAYVALQKAENAETLNVEDSQQLYREHRRAAQAATLRAANIRAQLGDIALKSYRYLEAASHYKLAADRAKLGSSQQKGYLNNAIGFALLKEGMEIERGQVELIDEAIQWLQVALEFRKRSKYPLDWVETKHSLGQAFHQIGWMKGDRRSLQLAIDNYCEALQELNHRSAFELWFRARRSLGETMQAMGWRESGSETLQKAVDVFRATLAELSREHSPIEWAKSQADLGYALRALGWRERTRGGATLLAEAVDAYRAAEEACSYERDQKEWIAIKVGLAEALGARGSAEKNKLHYKEADSVLRETLTRLHQEMMPAALAKVQMALANTNRELAAAESSEQAIAAAVATYGEALDSYRRDRWPLKWAETKVEMGKALNQLGLLKKDASTLQRAVAAYDDALAERTEQRTPAYWAETQKFKGHVLTKIAEWQQDARIRDDALNCLQMARDKYASLGMEKELSEINNSIDAIISEVRAGIDPNNARTKFTS